MSEEKLKIEHKRFIVKLLAVYESPSEVIEAVKETFDVTVTRQQLQHYDPTTVNGADLKKDLKELFENTRKEFEAAEPIPLGKKIVRVKKLSKYVDTLEGMGNYGKAMEAMEQIAKEQGGAFTNRREISGRDGKPVEIHSKTLGDWKKDAGNRTNEAAAVIGMFEDDGQESKPS